MVSGSHYCDRRCPPISSGVRLVESGPSFLKVRFGFGVDQSIFRRSGLPGHRYQSLGTRDLLWMLGSDVLLELFLGLPM